MPRKPRFPDITWYCDECNTCLNDQRGFDDHKYTWKCRECGFKNSISKDNINPDDPIALKTFLHFLGLQSFVGFWTAVMLGISLYVFHADKGNYFIPFLIFIGIFAVAFITTIVLQFTLRHKKKTMKWIILEILYDLKEDILMPFMALKEVLSNLLAFVTHLLPIPKKYAWHSNLKIIVMNTVYVALTVAEIIAFNHINHFTVSDGWILIQSGYAKVVEFVTGLFQ